MPNPVVIAFPFLPLAEPITFGGWWLGPACEFGGSWADAALKAMGTRFLESFRDAHGRPVRNPALLASADGGVSGARPGDVERAALRKAVAFATIDRNPPSGTTQISGHFLTTPDNADYWERPIDLQNGFITLERGGRSPQRTFCYRLEDPGCHISATPETVLPISPVRLDEVVVSALYEILVGSSADDSVEQTSRLSRAISWLE